MSARNRVAALLAVLGLGLAGAGCGGSTSSPAHRAQATTPGHPFHWPPAVQTTKLRPGQPCLPGRAAYYHRSALKCVNGRLRLLST